MKLVLRALLVLCVCKMTIVAYDGFAGGTGGNFFLTDEIWYITVKAESCVDSISVNGHRYGGSGGLDAGTLMLNSYVGSNERVIAIGGWHHRYIRSLWVQTTERRVTFGTSRKGDEFRFEAPPPVIIFHAWRVIRVV